MVAWPPLNVPVPSRVLPILSCTVPVGVPVAGATGLTVTVNVTVWPKTEGFGVEVCETVVLAWFTTCESVDDVLPVKELSPP